jgi:predicted short-subunit dehydrogenase-like oxidoreductase (DUF2520 family)
MSSEKTIVLIGAGNLATQLGMALHLEGYSITQVYSRTKKSATTLSKKLNTTPITDFKKLDATASIYIIAVKDDAIEEVVSQLKLTTGIVVHTSGSISMDVLKGTSKNYGVFYPLQTFSKNKQVDFRTVPICIEGNDVATTTTLLYFAKSISRNVKKINSVQRQKIHLAAVFACNFSNHLYSIAEKLLAKDKLSLNLLKPLIAETATKISNHSPALMQTGPATRADKKTMDAHLKLLSKEKDLQKIYRLLSESISKNA